MLRPGLAFASFAIACAAPAFATAERDAFLGSIAALCGKAFEGRVVTEDVRDKTMIENTLIMHFRECSDEAIAIPFHVGEDRSRTWRLTRTAEGVRLKHDHRHEDGSPDAVTMYGGDSTPPGTETRQEFPADEETKENFLANDLAVSITNVWAMEIHPGRMFVYELRREDRHFRIEFDLTEPVDAPPPPWGDAD